jgi:hypothetical protein
VYEDHSLKVRVVLCTPGQADKLEKALILKHNPRDNTMKYKSYIPTSKDSEIYEKYEFINEEPVPF